MIIPYLLSNEAFKEHVNAFDVNSLNLTPPENINLDDDEFLKLRLKMSRQLGYVSRFSADARKRKYLSQFTYITYFITNNIECSEFVEALWPETNPNKRENVSKFYMHLNNHRNSRAVHLKIFDEIRCIPELYCRLSKRMEPDADFNFDAFDKATFKEKFNAYCRWMTMGPWAEGMKLSVEQGLTTKILIQSKNEAIKNLEDFYSKLKDGNLIALWIEKKLNFLSVGNLRRLSVLLQKAYKVEFADEISEARKFQKQLNDRNRYTPKQSYSKSDKIELISECKAKGLSQKATVLKLGFSKGTVENYWNIDDTLKNPLK